MNRRQYLLIIGAIVPLLFSTLLFATESIKIGLVAQMTGSNAAWGKIQLNGLNLALDEINQAGGVLGRRLQLEIEDSQSDNSGSVLAFSKLANRGDIVAVIGSTRSTQVLAALPTIMKAGIPTLIGATDYMLTHVSNPWIFRVRPHNGYSAKAIADFGFNALKKKKWAIVYSTDIFGIRGKNLLIEALKSFGITPVMTQSVNTYIQDYTPVTHAIDQAGIDIVAVYMVRQPSAANLAISLRQSGIDSILIGSATLGGVLTRQVGGNALHESYAIIDFFADSSPQAKIFSEKYRKNFGQEADFDASCAYDAAHILTLAIKNANSTDPKAIRQAILALHAYEGANGTYNFDRNGDGLHGLDIVKNDRGKLVFVRRVSF